MVTGLKPRPARPAALKSELLKPGMSVGLYGGSFDPLHAAHRHVATTALTRLGLDRVWWLVSPGNPLKTHGPAPLADRLEAVRAAIPEPRHVVSDIEARLGTRRTLDLIKALQMRHPRVRFVWIMGADGLLHFHHWHGWQEIAARVPIVVVSRPGSGLQARLSPTAQRFRCGRLAQTRARALKSRRAGWTYLTEPLHPHASRLIRARQTRPT